jgi:hypothetical protein
VSCGPRRLISPIFGWGGQNEPRCTGSLLEALRIRFPGDSAPASPPPFEAGPTDLGTAQAAVRDTLGWPEGFAAGGSLTLRATSLSGGTFIPIWRDVRATSEGEPPLVGIARLRVRWAERKDLVGVAEGYFQSDRRNDPLIREKMFHRSSAALDFSEAYINGRIGSVSASFGRTRDAWLGRGTESLALSGIGPPLDRLLVSVDMKRFEGRAMVAMLDDVTLTAATDSFSSDLPPLRFRRVLYGHTLTIRPKSGIELSFGETMLSSRRGQEFDFAYLNPLMALVVTQDDTSRGNFAAGQDNLTVFGGARVRLGAATLGGELLVDELQVDAADRKMFQDQLAWRVDASVPLPLSMPGVLGMTYRHVNSFTYLKRRYFYVYQRYNLPLGSELGPDADLLEGNAEIWPTGLWRVSGSLGMWRHGGIRIDDRPGHDSREGLLPFPSTSTSRPFVQKAALGEIAVQFLGVASPITLRVQTSRINNANNLSAPAKTYARAQLIGTYAFRYP